MKVAYIRTSSIFDESRASKEILALLEAGYSLDIIGWDRNGNAEEECRKVFKDYSDRTCFYFFSGDDGMSLFGKLVCRLKWGDWVKKTIDLVPDIKIIHSCDYDTGYITRRICRKKKIRYIYDIYDYYVDAHPVPKLIKPFVEKDEIKTIDSSSVCIICSEERREQITKARPSRLIVIHNSPDIKRIQVEQDDEVYDYVYCGGLYNHRLIEEIMSGYSVNSDFVFLMAGSGTFALQAQELSDNYEGFTFLGPIAYENVLKLEAKSKVISAVYNPRLRNHRLCAPNKFYEALALGKPLIVCRGTGIDRIVRDKGIGCVIDYDAKDFYKALRYLVDNKEVRKEMGERAKELYEKEYQWDYMKEKLLAAYRQVI